MFFLRNSKIEYAFFATYFLYFCIIKILFIFALLNVGTNKNGHFSARPRIACYYYIFYPRSGTLGHLQKKCFKDTGYENIISIPMSARDYDCISSRFLYKFRKNPPSKRTQMFLHFYCCD